VEVGRRRGTLTSYIDRLSRKAGHISFGKPNSRHPFRVLSSSRRHLTKEAGDTRSTRRGTRKYFNGDTFDGFPRLEIIRG